MTTNKKPRLPKKAGALLAALFLLLGGTYLLTAQGSQAPTPQISLSEALAHVKAGQVSRATLNDGDNTVTLYLKHGVKATRLIYGATGNPKTAKAMVPKDGKVYANYPFAYGDDLTSTLVHSKVAIGSLPPTAPSVVVSLLTALVPVFLIIGALIWMVRSGALTGQIGKMNRGRGAQLGAVPTTRFTDVAGADEAVAELSEVVAFLANPKPFTTVGAKAPRGALLVGPPGTGKTLLARAVAGEAGVPFFAIAGSDFVETFVGVGAKRVRDLFDKARKAGGAIIFIDEIDAVGRRRAANPMGGEGERENTLISMLNEMDGFDASHRIIVLAATNRADVLDPALTRPGRLDRQIQVPAPDRRGREQILKVHTRGRPVAADLDLNAVALRTPGMAGADLEQLVNESCMEAARAGSGEVTAAHFDAALATLALGRARTSALVTERDRLITAWHEAGHTVAALLQPAADNPVSVSIVPRGPAGGVTWMSGSDDVFMTRSKALAQLRTAMAGRAAEELLLGGEYTTGAHGDLASATTLAVSMVTKYGMSEAGYLVVDDDAVRMGGDVGALVRATANQMLQDAHTDAYNLLTANDALLAAVAKRLLEDETINLAQILDIRACLVSAGVEQDGPLE